jgi:hypothetical protein
MPMIFKSKNQKVGFWIGTVLAGLFGLGSGMALIDAGHRGTGLNESSKYARSVAADRVLPAHEGQLIHVTGELRRGVIVDPETGVSFPGATRVERVVHVYKPFKSSRSSSNSPKGSWSERRDGGPMGNATFYLAGATLGALRVQPEMLGRVDLARASVNPATATALAGRGPLTTSEDFFDRGPGPCLYRGASPATPALGDVRICYQIATLPRVVTLVAEQRGGELVPHRPPRGGQVAIVLGGQHSLDQAYIAADARNRSDGKGGAGGALVMALIAAAVAYACRPAGRLHGGVT